MNIDVHQHFTPESVIEYIRKHSTDMQINVIEENGVRILSYPSGTLVPMPCGASDIAVRLEDMKTMRVQKAILSVGPNFFFYWMDNRRALDVAQLCNEWASETAQKNPALFACMATIPMQDVKIALDELKRAHEQLGLRALEIAPIIKGKHLDDEFFFPVFEYCADKGILLYLHPYVSEQRSEYERYYNGNLIGAALETNIGINHLLFGGVFERFPALNVLTSHGGGYFPYQFGRLMHGYKVRQEPKAKGAKSPENYLKNIYFDTITHWTPSLQFLINTFGADHIVLGSDYPYDMGDHTPIDSLDKIKLTAEQRAMISHINIERLIG